MTNQYEWTDQDDLEVEQGYQDVVDALRAALQAEDGAGVENPDENVRWIASFEEYLKEVLADAKSDLDHAAKTDSPRFGYYSGKFEAVRQIMEAWESGDLS